MIERKQQMKTLLELRDRHIIKVIIGVRRSGKSILLEMFADEIKQTVPDKRIQFLNFEDPDVLAIGDWKQVYDHIKSGLDSGSMNYIFLDEVQNIESFERLVDGLYIKKNVDLYVTGSNGYLLSGELATLLTGRYIEIEMLPFSFAEYRDAMSNSPNISKDESFGNFLFDGGIPQAVEFREINQKQADEFLNGLITTIIEKDIYKRRRIYNKPMFNKVMDYLADSVGSYASPKSIANIFKNEGITIDHKTITTYLNYLSSTFLFYKVPRYNIKGKNLLRTLDKYYVVDPGFRSARLGKQVGTDRGHLLENAVYLELRRRNRHVYVGKLRDKEVDFVAMDHAGYISYYQVAYSVVDEKTLGREITPLRMIRDSNAKYLLSADWDGNPVYDGIRKLNVIDWLLGEANTM
ncbi:MAG: ATP-binding protein [Clostridiales Family XIII bacterium]|jgi:predicted AAA+ superfamily ATPase|nr:ATP-binding protein [Clostridiales Family XIII bacterium]